MCDCFDRRALLRAALVMLQTAAAPALAFGASEARRLRFYHTHTGQRLSVTYSRNGAYDDGALAELNAFLSDFRTGDVVAMDPSLFDLLYAAQQQLGSRGTYEVISAYRSPKTNEMLRRTGGGGVAKKSQHLVGRAIDVRLTDVATADLRKTGLELARGGVGYYPKSDFVHLDTGRVRSW